MKKEIESLVNDILETNNDLLKSGYQKYISEEFVNKKDTIKLSVATGKYEEISDVVNTNIVTKLNFKTIKRNLKKGIINFLNKHEMLLVDDYDEIIKKMSLIHSELHKYSLIDYETKNFEERKFFEVNLENLLKNVLKEEFKKDFSKILKDKKNIELNKFKEIEKEDRMRDFVESLFDPLIYFKKDESSQGVLKTEFKTTKKEISEDYYSYNDNDTDNDYDYDYDYDYYNYNTDGSYNITFEDISIKEQKDEILNNLKNKLSVINYYLKKDYEESLVNCIERVYENNNFEIYSNDEDEKVSLFKIPGDKTYIIKYFLIEGEENREIFERIYQEMSEKDKKNQKDEKLEEIEKFKKDYLKKMRKLKRLFEEQGKLATEEVEKYEDLGKKIEVLNNKYNNKLELLNKEMEKINKSSKVKVK